MAPTPDIMCCAKLDKEYTGVSTFLNCSVSNNSSFNIIQDVLCPPRAKYFYLGYLGSILIQIQGVKNLIIKSLQKISTKWFTNVHKSR